MNQENLQKLHQSLSQTVPGFAEGYDEFVQDMSDESNRRRLHGNLPKYFDGFARTYRQFSSDMGLDVAPLSMEAAEALPWDTPEQARTRREEMFYASNEGKAAKKAFDDGIAAVNDKYSKEWQSNVEYNSIMNQYRNGTITQEQADKAMKERYQAIYGKQIEKENKLLSDKFNDQYSHYTDDALLYDYYQLWRNGVDVRAAMNGQDFSRIPMTSNRELNRKYESRKNVLEKDTENALRELSETNNVSVEDYKRTLRGEKLIAPKEFALQMIGSGDDPNEAYTQILKKQANDAINGLKSKKEFDEVAKQWVSLFKEERNAVTKREVEALNNRYHRIASEYNDCFYYDDIERRRKVKSGQASKAKELKNELDIIGATRKNYENAQDILEKPYHGDNAWKAFWKGFKDSATDIDTWLWNIPSVVTHLKTVKPIFEKSQRGEELSDAEVALMDSILYQQQAEALRSGTISNAYTGGNIAAESLPFMVEFMLTGGITGKLVSKGLTGYGKKKAKQLLAASVKKGGKKLSAKEAEALVTRYATRTAGKREWLKMGIDAAITPVQMVFMPSTYTGMIQNMSQKVTDRDKHGNYEFEDGQHWARAGYEVWKEVVSEKAGGLLELPAGRLMKYIGKVAKRAGKLEGTIGSLAKYGKAILQPMGQFAEKTGVHGIVGETFEEVFGNGMDFTAAGIQGIVGQITGDEQLQADTREWQRQNKEFWAADNLESMLIGFSLMPLGGTIKATLGVPIAKVRQSRSMNNLQYRLQNIGMSLEESTSFIHDLMNTDVKDLKGKIAEFFVEHNIRNVEQRNNITTSIVQALAYQTAWNSYLDSDFSKDEYTKRLLSQTSQADELSDYVWAQQAKMESMVHSSGNLITAVTNEGSQVFITEGSVKIRENGSVDLEKSSNRIVVTDATGTSRIIRTDEIQKVTGSMKWDNNQREYVRNLATEKYRQLGGFDAIREQYAQEMEQLRRERWAENNILPESEVETDEPVTVAEEATERVETPMVEDAPTEQVVSEGQEQVPQQGEQADSTSSQPNIDLQKANLPRTKDGEIDWKKLKGANQFIDAALEEGWSPADVIRVSSAQVQSLQRQREKVVSDEKINEFEKEARLKQIDADIDTYQKFLADLQAKNLENEEKDIIFADANSEEPQRVAVNITQNAGEGLPQGGTHNRSGELNKQDRQNVINNLWILRNPKRTKAEKQQAKSIIDSIQERRKQEMELAIQKALSGIEGVSFVGIKKGLGVYQGRNGEVIEYTFKVELDIEQGKEQEAIAAMAMVAEACKQDSYIMNYEGNEQGDPARQVRVKLQKPLTLEEQAELTQMFSAERLGLTITEDEITTSYFPDNWDAWGEMSEEEKETYRREFVDKTINLLNIFNHGNAATSIRNEGVSEVGETATSISGGMPSLARYGYQSGRLAGLVIDVRNNYSDYIEHDKGEENSDERSYRSRYTRQREAAEEGENGVHLQEEYIIPDTESRLQSVKDVLTEPSEPEAETPEAVDVTESEPQSSQIDLSSEDVIIWQTGDGTIPVRHDGQDEFGEVYTNLLTGRRVRTGKPVLDGKKVVLGMYSNPNHTTQDAPDIWVVLLPSTDKEKTRYASAQELKNAGRKKGKAVRVRVMPMMWNGSVRDMRPFYVTSDELVPQEDKNGFWNPIFYEREDKKQKQQSKLQERLQSAQTLDELLDTVLWSRPPIKVGGRETVSLRDLFRLRDERNASIRANALREGKDADAEVRKNRKTLLQILNEAVLNGIRQVSSKNETEDTRRTLAEAIEKQVQRDNWKMSDTQRDLVKDIQGAAKQAIERWNEMVSEQHLDEVLDTLLQGASEAETASDDDVRSLVDKLDSLLPNNKSVREKLKAELPKVFVPGMSKSELLEAAIRKVEEVIPIKNKESKRNRSAISKRFSQMLGVDDAVRSTFGDEFADALSAVEHTMKIKEGTSDDWAAAEKNNPLEWLGAAMRMRDALMKTLVAEDRTIEEVLAERKETESSDVSDQSDLPAVSDNVESSDGRSVSERIADLEEQLYDTEDDAEIARINQEIARLRSVDKQQGNQPMRADTPARRMARNTVIRKLKKILGNKLHLIGGQADARRMLGLFGNNKADLMATQERARKIASLNPISIVKHSYNKEELKDIYKQLDDCKKDGLLIKFYHGIFGKAWHGENSLFAKVVPQLHDILEQSELAWSEGENQAGQKKRDGSTHKKHENIVQYRYYVGKVEIDGKEYYVRTTVQEEKSGDVGTHSFFVSDVQLYDNSFHDVTTDTKNHLGDTSVKGIVDAKLQQFFKLANLSEKQIEAQIAYHGSGIELLQTPNGTIYGWSIGDEIYLTEEGMNPETPIHEYTHLWAKALRKQNSKAWKRIVKLCKQSKALWDAVVADENYSQLEGDEDAIASEVLARYSGQRGAERMDEAMQKAMQEHPTWGEEAQSEVAVSSLKKALRNFWQWVCDTLGIRYRNLDEVSDKALYDLLNESELEKKETNFDKKIAETLDKGGRNVLSLQEISELTNTLLNDIRQGNRPLVYQRVPFEALQGLLGEQQTLAELLTIVSRKSRRQHRSLERDGREVTSEEIVSRDGSNTEMLLDLIQYAKEKGIWIEDVVDTLNERYGKDNYVGHGAESEVWVDKERGVVIKAKVNNYYETMEEFLEGILLNNWLFGENQQRIIGIGIDRRSGSDGIRIIYETPYVETKNATPLTQEEKDEFMAGFGFEKQDHESIHSEKKGESSSYTNGEFIVGDLHNMNIVRDENGEIRCTDPIIRWVRGEHYREQIADEVERDAENEGRLDEMFEGSDAIEMMVGSADPYDIDRIIAEAREEYARKKLADFEAEKKKSDKPVGVVEQTKEYREWIAKASDRTHPILLIEKSINRWRKNLGKPALRWSQKVRGYIESERARKSARLKDFIRKQDKELLSQVDKIGKEIKKQIKDKSNYGGFDRFRKDKNGKKISPVNLIELYLIARSNQELAEMGRDTMRGEIAFLSKMGVTMNEFVNIFHSYIAEEDVNKLWESIRAVSDLGLDTALESGLITKESYDEYKTRRFYVPQKGFDDVEQDDSFYIQSRQRTRKESNRGSAFAHRAEGGQSLAVDVLSYLRYDTRDVLQRAEENKTKQKMYELLQDNADWASNYGIPQPYRIWYVKNDAGEWERTTEEPSEEVKKRQADLLREIKSLKKELTTLKKSAARLSEGTPEKDAKLKEIEEKQKEIDALNAILPLGTSRIVHLNEMNRTTQQAAAGTVSFYVNGEKYEMDFGGMETVANALNNTFTDTKIPIVSRLNGLMSAVFTSYNIGFPPVNFERDLKGTLEKGTVHYGLEFPLYYHQFLGDREGTMRPLRQWLDGTLDERTPEGKMMYDFVMGGGPTGYTQLQNVQDLHNQMREVEKYFNATDLFDRILSLNGLTTFVSEYSELWTRFTTYRTVYQIRLKSDEFKSGKITEEDIKREAIDASKNMGLNLDRKGGGAFWIDLINQMTLFANPIMQGMVGYWRSFDSLKHTAIHVFTGMIIPTILGYLFTMWTPDDDDDEFSPSDYERTHYALLGKNWRLSLNEQLGAWYVLGAYARMVQDESRKPKDAARWVGRSMWENMLMPHPFISKPVGDLMTDENRHKMDIIASMFIPTSMDNISDLLRMENGFGGSLEDYDFNAIAQAVMGEHKTELSKDIAKKIYGGTENAPSKFKMVTKGEAEEGGIERTDDINPKIVESILRFMPASDFEIIAYLYGFGKGLKNGDTIGKALQEEKLPVFNRFWQRRDPEIYRYNRMQKLNKKYKAILNNYTTLKYNEAALEDQLINRIDLDSTKIAELEKDLRDVQAEIELYEIDGGILPNGISTLEEWARALGNYKQAGLYLYARAYRTGIDVERMKYTEDELWEMNEEEADAVVEINRLLQEYDDFIRSKR